MLLEWLEWGTAGTVVLVLASAMFVAQLATFSTTIYLHRTLTHRGLSLKPAMEWLFRFWLWITTGIKRDQWKAVHLKHHAFTDETGDPHSPLIQGFWKVQLGNVFYYLREAKNPDTLRKYAHDIVPDVWDRVFKRSWLGLAIGISTLCLLLGLWWGLLAAALHTFLYVFVLSSSINGLCHFFGYRNFRNTATNIRLVAWFTGGEGLHNNHHGYPRSPKLSWRQAKRFEFDPAWPVIRLLIALRLARPWQTIDQMASD